MLDQASLYFARKRRKRRHHHASAVLTFTGQPNDGETVTIGSTVYTFTGAGVVIGADLAHSIANLAAALNLSGVVNSPEHSGTTIKAASVLGSFSGVGIPVSTTVTGATWSRAALAL